MSQYLTCATCESVFFERLSLRRYYDIQVAYGQELPTAPRLEHDPNPVQYRCLNCGAICEPTEVIK